MTGTDGRLHDGRSARPTAPRPLPTPGHPSVRTVPPAAFAAVVALCMSLPDIARAAPHPAWAADRPYNGAWITEAEGSYPNRDPRQIPDQASLLPAWISRSLRSAGLRMESNDEFVAPTTYQVFAPDPSTRVIAFVSYGTAGCPAQMSDPDDPEPTPCLLRVLTVHADATLSAMRSTPGCSGWWVSPTPANHTEFRRIQTTGRIEMRVIVRGHVDRACSASITP